MIKALFNFILIWLVFLSSLGYTINRLEDPEFLTAQVREAKLYDRLTAHLDAVFPKNEVDKLPFTNEDLRQIITKTIDANTFYDALGSAASAYGNWLQGNNSTIGFSYDLAPLKEQFITNATDTALAAYASQPVCKSQEIANWGRGDALPECRLSGNDTGETTLKPLVQKQLNETIGKLPNTLVSGEASPELLRARETVHLVNKVILTIWLVTFAIILLYLVLLRARAFFSLAIIFIVAGLLEIGFGLIGWEWIRQTLVDLFSNQGATWATFVVDLTASLVEILKTILGNLSIISLSLGGLFLILGVFFGFKSRAKV